MVIINAANSTVENNVFTRSAGNALMITQAGIKVKDNVIAENGYRGLGANRADGSVVSGNHIAFLDL